ncbi:hypothetical protein [uncultured Duncaniella sp.]|uniref:hypothetical protein n=1 Tax=uncultured Duncaniella sp. TaxID=2768039 RepID=UPI00272B6A02|nr:hypothetical protein [uncultured Duncaniella sp.]
MSLLKPNNEADFNRYMEKRFEFERNFKSRVVSVLIIDPKGEFPLKDLKFEGVNTKYFDLSNITERDYHLMGKWITERISDGGFAYDGLMFDNADCIPTDFEEKQDEYNMEQMLISALKRDDFQILPSAYPCEPIPFNKIMVAVRCRKFPKYLWGKDLQTYIIEV